jgi:hypothetical protein
MSTPARRARGVYGEQTCHQIQEPDEKKRTARRAETSMGEVWRGRHGISARGSDDGWAARALIELSRSGRMSAAKGGRERCRRQGKNEKRHPRRQGWAVAYQGAVATGIAVGHAGVLGHARMVLMGPALRAIVDQEAGDVMDRGPRLQGAGERGREDDQGQGNEGQPSDKTALSALADHDISERAEPWTPVQT